MNIIMPVLEIRRALFACAFRAPGFLHHIVALDDTDEVHHRSLPETILDDVAAGAHPVGADRLEQMLRQRRGWDHASPSHQTCDGRPVLSEQGLPNGRVNPVGTDENVAAGAFAILEPYRRTG